MTKLIGVIQKIDKESVFIDNQEYILLQNAYKYINKLKAGLKVELTLNEDDDITFFKVLDNLSEKKDLNTKSAINPQKTNRNEQLFGLCLKLANNKILLDNGKITPEAWVKETNRLARMLHDEVQK